MNPKLISKQMLAWYTKNRRDLPWRHTQNPYYIWVSEIMLQQTQVDTVIPFYNHFIKRFPTIETLASASLQDVLIVWENMGYYARARNLHRAAKEVLTVWGGQLPDSKGALLKLPGIGDYTASAILSIAYGQRVPTVDGNVRRLLSRLFLIREPVDQVKTLEHIYKLAEELCSVEDPGSSNQAMMEMGATICIPRNPLCRSCPLQKGCGAYREGIQLQLPRRKKKSPIPHKDATAALILNRQRQLLITRRPDRGLLGGLWKFPGGPAEKGEGLAESLHRCLREELGIRVRVREKLFSVKHAYTHFRVTLHLFRCVGRRGEPHSLGCAQWQWAESDSLERYPFSRVDRKLMETLRDKGFQI